MYASATCAERTYNLQVERPGQHTASVAAVQAAGTNVHASARYRPSAATRCRAAIERAISKPVQQDTNSNAAEGTGEGRRTFNRPDKLTSSPSQQKRNSHRSQPLTGPRQSVNSAEDLAPKQLTGLIKRTGKPQELQQLVLRHSTLFNHIHIAAVMTRLGQWQKQNQFQTPSAQKSVTQILQDLDQLLLLSQQGLQDSQPQQLSIIIHSCSLLGQTHVGFYDRCLQQFMSSLDNVQQLQSVSMVLYGLAVSGQRVKPTWFSQLLAVAGNKELLDKAEPALISNVIWGAGKMQQSIPTQHLQLLVTCLISKGDEIKPQDVSNCLWGMAKMGQRISKRQIQQLITSMLADRAALIPQNVSNSLWAVATMGEQIPEQLVHQLLLCLLEKQRDLHPQAVSNSLWAVANMGQQVPGQMLQQLVAHMLKKESAIRPQHVSNILLAVAKMDEQLPEAQMQQLVTCLLRRTDDLSPQAVSNSIWAIATMGQSVAEPQTQQLVNCMMDQLANIKPQEVSNTLWAVATMGQHIQEQQTQQLVTCLVDNLAVVKPQEVSNTLWAVANMGQSIPDQQMQQLLAFLTDQHANIKPQNISNALLAVAKMGQRIPEQQLQQLIECLLADEHGSKSQAVSNSLWAIATMEQQLPDQQVQRLISCLFDDSDRCKLQHTSNALWAVARMKASVHPQQLQQLEAAFVGHVTQVKGSGHLDSKTAAIDVSGALWGFGTRVFFPQQLLEVLHEEQLWQILLPVMEPRGLAQTAVAFGALGHRDEQLIAAVLQQAVQGVRRQQQQQQQVMEVSRDSDDGSSSSWGLFTGYELSNLCWSIAVLDLQQHIPYVLVLMQCCAQQFETCDKLALLQIQQVQLWLQDVQGRHGTALGGILTLEQLEQCRAARAAELQLSAAKDPSHFHQEVFAVVQQLPIAWRKHPVMEQLTEPDGMFSMDISGVTADGVRLAIEADGPSHFRYPDYKPTGSTMDRNRALAARGYVVVSVPQHVWQQQQGLDAKQQYMMDLLQQQLALHAKLQQQPALFVKPQQTEQGVGSDQQPGRRRRRIRRSSESSSNHGSG